MNNYIYKVRFVTLNFPYITRRTKILHKHKYLAINKQFNCNFNNRLQTNYEIVEKYEYFMSILMKMLCLHFGTVNFTS